MYGNAYFAQLIPDWKVTHKILITNIMCFALVSFNTLKEEEDHEAQS